MAFTETYTIKDLVVCGLTDYINQYGENWIDYYHTGGDKEIAESIFEEFGVAINYNIIDDIIDGLDIRVNLDVRID